MNILVLIKDLVLSTQIRGACEQGGVTYNSARNNDKFKESLESLKPEKIIIDLNIDGADPFKAIEDSKVAGTSDKITCFFSHVNVELAEKAIELGLSEDQIQRRSKFFNDLSQIVN